MMCHRAGWGFQKLPPLTRKFRSVLATVSVHQGLTAEPLLAHDTTQWGSFIWCVATGPCRRYLLPHNETPTTE